jgi:hypothetical protein
MNRCYAKNCDRLIPPGRPMCLSHWRCVSPGTQKLVLRELKLSKQAGRPGESYVAAMKLARAEVAEFQPVTHRTRDLLEGAEDEKWDQPA